MSNIAEAADLCHQRIVLSLQLMERVILTYTEYLIDISMTGHPQQFLVPVW